MKSDVPKGASFEGELALGIALWDVSHLLPTRGKGYPRRPGTIDLFATHHSGRLGSPGFAGMHASARYSTSVVRDKETGKIKKSGWPGFAYTFWLPFHDARDAEGRRVVYRGNPDDRRTYHTGGKANDRGVACVWQGNLTNVAPSKHQVECAEALYPWAGIRYGLTREDFIGHSESKPFGGTGKKACPGPNVLEWLRLWRKGWDVA
ncbi:MAG: peptidoglycan recognition family protein [Myxococcota bacterium]